MNLMQAANLIKQINEASFAMDDIALYLDTHPSDANALQYYSLVTALRKEAVSSYEAFFGPLLLDNVCSKEYWTWETDVWPWEGVV